MGINVTVGMFVGLAQRQENWAKTTEHHRTTTRGLSKPISVPSVSKNAGMSTESWGFVWAVDDFLMAHCAIRESGKLNFELCRIPVPTKIRYDRLEESLGDRATAKDLRTLSLLKYGMPIDCKPGFGISKVQKNHFSAVGFSNEVGEYFINGLKNQALIGPFEKAPIPELCYSPLMSVPKDTKRRVIVDFSFPAGRSVNDGISANSYLGFEVDFSLPSVQSMVYRLNNLGVGCLMYKRDLKSAFRQFSIDPGDYKYTGLSWKGEIFLDTRLAMGLRSSAYCCQSVTEMVAKVAGNEAFVLVYLDDFGGAELDGKAFVAFEYLGRLLNYFGLEESLEKAVAPTTRMDWLGICFDSIEWTMALKPGKLQELLILLPKLLCYKRVKKVTLQKVLGSLVWASAVVRAGTVFFNRLLVLLRKLKRPNHSIYFSTEAKKDVAWWHTALVQFGGKCPIPPSVWTPLVSFYTDASLEGFGMLWGKRALAGIFTIEFDELDITKKEMLTVMAAIKHWFSDLANLKVRIFVDNQACMELLNYGITKSPFLAACLREISFFLARFNIELKADYIPSKENYLADICSRAYINDKYFASFNKLLLDGTLKLENILYNKFGFELNL